MFMQSRDDELERAWVGVRVYTGEFLPRDEVETLVKAYGTDFLLRMLAAGATIDLLTQNLEDPLRWDTIKKATQFNPTISAETFLRLAMINAT